MQNAVNSSASGIVATRVSRAFGAGAQRTKALADVNLLLHAGELTLLMGPSGSGKSTLLAVLSGLTRPDTGEVFALGQSIWRQSAAQVDDFRARHCGFVFQGFNLFSSLRAQDQVELALGLIGVPARDLRARAHAALDDVGLGSRRHLLPEQMSGGEKQRVAIARALAKRPRLLFADEPTSALDRHNAERVTHLLRRCAHEQGAVVLCVTHDQRLADFADRVLRIDDGRIVGDDRNDIESKGPAHDQNSAA